MRAVIQRVSQASVAIAGETVAQIGKGSLVLLGVTHEDTDADVAQLADKTIGLRIFDDGEGKMNLSLREIGGSLLVVSQFTLYADTRRGRRPSFLQAAKGDAARALYEAFIQIAKREVGIVEQGRFGAMMDVHLVNDGPVTIILDTRSI